MASKVWQYEGTGRVEVRGITSEGSGPVAWPATAAPSASHRGKRTGQTGGQGSLSAASDHLAALERRGDELEAFASAERQALDYIGRVGTQALVDELRQAIKDRRRVKLGTINTIVLLRHIERLEAEVAKEPIVHA